MIYSWPRQYCVIYPVELAAFEESGEKLARTASACGFRWNSAIRREYEKEKNRIKIKATTEKGCFLEQAFFSVYIQKALPTLAGSLTGSLRQLNRDVLPIKRNTAM